MPDLPTKTQHARDEAWAELRQYRDTIDRIAEEGPTREDDALVMFKVFSVVSAELSLRAAGLIE